MKHAQPIITVIENRKDVQSYRDSNGYVLEIGNTVITGLINDNPTGIRIFPNIKACLAYLSETMIDVEPLIVANKPGPKAKIIKRGPYKKRKAAVKKVKK